MGLWASPIKVPQIYPVSMLNGSEKGSGVITSTFSSFFWQPKRIISPNKKTSEKKQELFE
jgi:hypothetical protein